MRVVFFAHDAGLYGANRSLLALVVGLKRLGVQELIVVPEEGPLVNELGLLNIKFIVLNFRWWVSKYPDVSLIKRPGRSYLRTIDFYRRNKLTFLNLVKIVRQVRKFNPCLIYSNSSVINIGSLVSKTMRLPHIWHFREIPDLSYRLYFDYNSKIRNYFFNDSTVVFNSNYLAEYFQRLGFRRRYVVYNGILDESIIAANELKIKNKIYSGIKFLIVGNISPLKGQHIAVEAMQYLKSFECHLNIVGQGDQVPLLKLAGALNVEDRIHFFGHVNDISEIYNSGDVLLMCSKSEAFGRVTAEAMANGLPVIGFNGGATKELISNGETGLLYEGEAKELADKMKIFIKDPVKIQEIGLNAWKYAGKYFSNEKYINDIFNIITETIRTEGNNSDFN